uniref:Uncharacterized protein n=1 Tax=Brassica oleracea var. oleracea TaxID=109376 RepID=A0A0D3BDF1_BRAOL
MTNIEKLQFPALKITGENYVGWVTNVKPYLVMKKITETIVIGNKSPPEHIAETIIFLKKHLDENLTHDYANVEDPAELWQTLKERFDNQRQINLPHALEEWKNLRKCGYTRFSELMVALMLAEKNNELLIKNHNSRPTGAKAFPEVNATAVENSERRNQTNRGYGHRFNNKREKLTIPNGRDLTRGLDPNKFLRVKKLKKTPPRSVGQCVTDVDVKNIGPVSVVLLHISVSYTKSPRKAKLKK